MLNTRDVDGKAAGADPESEHYIDRPTEIETAMSMIMATPKTSGLKVWRFG